MPSSRLSLRLGQLPLTVLADLAARLCAESPALQAAAEECMAAHNPLPHEMVERVLLSPDLVPHILGPLEAEDGAAAAVCSQWLAGWKATNEPRRRLKQGPFDFPEGHVRKLVAKGGLDLAGTPDGRLVVRAGHEVRILDSSMHVLQTVEVEHDGMIAASDDSIFCCFEGLNDMPPALRRISHDGTTAAEYQLEGYDFFCPVLAPGGLLFCVIFEEEGRVIFEEGRVIFEEGRDEIIALDAQTLQLRHRFGRGLLNDDDHVCQLAVVGDELYVCDTGNHRLQVFALTGEHRRSVTGEWRSPVRLCFAKDRLYLVERAQGITLQGRRILVLSLQGDILQVVTHPTEPTATFGSICCFDGKLLASYEYTESAGKHSGHHSRKYGMLLLQGV